ncbi:MAG: hypothetical protein ABIE70_07460 [bacterium]
MKINPIGLQSYQESVRRDNQPTNADPSQVSPQPTTDKTVKIRPQDEAQRSRMAVRAPRSTYADNLSPEEQRAMELLFSRFRDAGRFGPGYVADPGTTDQATPGLGGLVDVKA